MKRRGWFAVLGSALLIGGAIFFWRYEQQVQAAQEAQARARDWLARPPAMHEPPPRGPRRGEVLGELEIPRLKLSVMVFEGDDLGILKIGAGHIPGTALPLSTGNVGVAAHRDSYFRPLRDIRKGDEIQFRTPIGVLRYRVTDLSMVVPSDVGVLKPVPGRDLTLVTCYPFYFVGKAPQRFIVHARLVYEHG
jgi:sortase A